MKTIVKLLTTIIMVPAFLVSQETQDTTEQNDSGPERVFHESRFDWGITAGATYGLVEFGNLGRKRNEIASDKSAMGYQIGVFVHPQSDMFYVRPALLYSRMGGELNTPRPTDFVMHKIELPMLFGIRAYRHWCIEGGPIVAHILSKTSELNGYGEVRTGRSGLGYHAGIAWDNNRFVFKAALQGITYENPGLTASFREKNQLVLTAGYKFSGVPQFSAGTKKFRKVYLPQGKNRMRIRYFRF